MCYFQFDLSKKMLMKMMMVMIIIVIIIIIIIVIVIIIIKYYYYSVIFNCDFTVSSLCHVNSSSHLAAEQPTGEQNGCSSSSRDR